MEDNANKLIFANNLKYQMAVNNKSRREVSEALNISYYTFSDWVNGKKYPRMDKVEMLANYFGILKSDLIEEKEKPTVQNDEFSENQRKLMDFVKSVPDEQAEMILRVIRSIVESE